MTTLGSQKPDAAGSNGGHKGPAFRMYLLVLLVAAVMRLAWAGAVPVAPLSDCAMYDGAARRLAQGLPYTIDEQSNEPSAHWPVGTAFMYSLVYRVFDPVTSGYRPVVVLNLAISLAVVALSMALAAKWFGARAGTVTGFLVALWPMHIEFTTVIASEPVFTACMLAGLLVWPAPGTLTRREHRWTALASLCFALATYVRPTSLLFPAILGGIEFLRTRRVVPPLSRAVFATIIVLVLMTPWTIRNYRVFDRLVLSGSTNGGTNMWMGNNPDTTGFYQPPPPRQPNQNEAEWDKDLGGQANAYIKAEPVAFVKRTLIKAVKLHDRETIGVAWNKDGLARVSPKLFDPQSGIGGKVLKAASTGYWYLMLAGAGAGFVILMRRDGLWRAVTHPTVVFFAYFTAVHAIMVIQDRYHYPITPMVAALASVSIASILDKRARAKVASA